MDKRDLISDEYCKLNAAIYNTSKRSAGGAKHATEAEALANKHQCKTILDYGCGQGFFKMAFEINSRIKISEYDPAIIGKNILPKPADLVICTDVLEHVEPEKIDAVLKHIKRLMVKAGYFTIALCPTKEFLPDGRNAHVLLKTIDWWLLKIIHHGFLISDTKIIIKKQEIKELRVWMIL